MPNCMTRRGRGIRPEGPCRMESGLGHPARGRPAEVSGQRTSSRGIRPEGIRTGASGPGIRPEGPGQRAPARGRPAGHPDRGIRPEGIRPADGEAGRHDDRQAARGAGAREQALHRPGRRVPVDRPRGEHLPGHSRLPPARPHLRADGGGRRPRRHRGRRPRRRRRARALHGRRVVGGVPLILRGEAAAAPRHLREAPAARPLVPRARAHLGGRAGLRRGRRPARDLLRLLPPAALLRPARAPHALRRARAGEPPRRSGAARLRAAHPRRHRRRPDLGEAPALQVLGELHGARRHLPREPAGAHDPQGLRGRRDEAARDERAGRGVPPHHHARARHAAQLHRRHGCRRLRRRGGGHRRGPLPVPGGGGRPRRMPHDHAARGRLLPSHAPARVVLPHRHERHGGEREDLPPARCRGARRGHAALPGALGHPRRGARLRLPRRGRRLPDRPVRREPRDPRGLVHGGRGRERMRQVDARLRAHGQESGVHGLRLRGRRGACGHRPGRPHAARDLRGPSKLPVPRHGAREPPRCQAGRHGRRAVGGARGDAPRRLPARRAGARDPAHRAGGEPVRRPAPAPRAHPGASARHARLHLRRGGVERGRGERGRHHGGHRGPGAPARRPDRGRHLAPPGERGGCRPDRGARRRRGRGDGDPRRARRARGDLRRALAGAAGTRGARCRGAIG